MRSVLLAVQAARCRLHKCPLDHQPKQRECEQHEGMRPPTDTETGRQRVDLLAGCGARISTVSE